MFYVCFLLVLEGGWNNGSKYIEGCVNGFLYFECYKKRFEVDIMIMFLEKYGSCWYGSFMFLSGVSCDLLVIGNCNFFRCFW